MMGTSHESREPGYCICRIRCPATLRSGALAAASVYERPEGGIENADKSQGTSPTGLVELSFDATLRLTANGRSHVTERRVYRVISEAGAKALTQTSQVWAPWKGEKPGLRARVITRDGVAHELDQRTITEAGVPTQVEGLFTDLKILRAPLPAVAAGAVIELEFDQRDREDVAPTEFGPEGATAQLQLPGETPIEYFHVTIEAPAGSTLHIDQHRVPRLDRKNTTDGATRRVELSASELKVPATLSLLPPDQAGTPTIAASTVAGWQQVAKWYSAVAEGQTGVAQPKLDPQADLASRMEGIEKILAEIQRQVRYTGVELGFAALEPRTPAETLSRGFGDCKDKAVLLVSRLRAAGIAAWVALVTPEPFADVSRETPDIQAFRHAIVYVPGKRRCGSTRQRSLLRRGGCRGPIRGVSR